VKKILRILIGLSLLSWAQAADQIPPELARSFDQIAQKADTVQARSGPEAAIPIYEEALLTHEGYGRIHLRLGQIHKRLKQFPEAAEHFKACQEDERVDALDRKIICEKGFLRTTALFELDSVPAQTRVVIIKPERFAGLLRSGMRLPLGELRLMVESPGRYPKESKLELKGPMTWRVALGLSRRDGPLISEGFLEGEGSKNEGLDPFLGPDPAGGVAPKESLRWPAYTALSLGVALLGTGYYLGSSNQDHLEKIRSDQRSGGCGRGYCGSDLDEAENQAKLADGVWITGSVIAASSVLLWFLFEQPSSSLEEGQE